MQRLSFPPLGVLLLVGLPILAQQPAKPPPPPILPAQARLDQTIGGLGGPGLAVAGNDEAGILAVGCESGIIRYWGKSVTLGVRVGEGTPNQLTGHQGPITALAWSAGPFLASAAADRKVILWQMPDGQPVHTLEGPGVVRALAMSPDGKVLAGGGDDGTVQLWDVAPGKPGARLQGPTDWVLSLTFSPDGKLLAGGGYDGVVRLWDVAAGKKLLDIPAQAPPAANAPPPPPNAVWALAFSPDSKLLAIGGADAQVYLVNPADGKIVRPIPGHTSSVTALAFHPSGTLLVSASKDRTVRLWNPANGQAIKALEGHGAWVQGLTFLAQGTRLASVSADQTVRLWDLTDPMKK